MFLVWLMDTLIQTSPSTFPQQIAHSYLFSFLTRSEWRQWIKKEASTSTLVLILFAFSPSNGLCKGYDYEMKIMESTFAIISAWVIPPLFLRLPLVRWVREYLLGPRFLHHFSTSDVRAESRYDKCQTDQISRWSVKMVWIYTAPNFIDIYNCQDKPNKMNIWCITIQFRGTSSKIKWKSLRIIPKNVIILPSIRLKQARKSLSR